MKTFSGKALRWEWRDGVIEVTLDREPANEIGFAMLAELEQFVAAFGALLPETSACIICSARKQGFSAGADLRELYHGAAPLSEKDRIAGIRQFLERIHAVLNALDAAPFVTIAADTFFAFTSIAVTGVLGSSSTWSSAQRSREPSGIHSSGAFPAR